MKNSRCSGITPAALSIFLLLLSACDSRPEFTEQVAPFMEIIDGQFDVNAVLTINTANPTDSLLGSGSLSFDFNGDTSGTFSATGALVNNQSTVSGVGAVLDRVDNLDFNTIDEGLSLLAFIPLGNGKADIFSLGTRLTNPVDSVQAGESFAIGPNAPFVAAYFKGVNITDFWRGSSNLFETAEAAFGFTAGSIFISERDSLHIRGNFFCTTDPARSSDGGIFILK